MLDCYCVSADHGGICGKGVAWLLETVWAGQTNRNDNLKALTPRVSLLPTTPGNATNTWTR